MDMNRERDWTIFFYEAGLVVPGVNSQQVDFHAVDDLDHVSEEFGLKYEAGKCSITKNWINYANTKGLNEGSVLAMAMRRISAGHHINIRLSRAGIPEVNELGWPCLFKKVLSVSDLVRFVLPSGVANLFGEDEQVTIQALIDDAYTFFPMRIKKCANNALTITKGWKFYKTRIEAKYGDIIVVYRNTNGGNLSFRHYSLDGGFAQFRDAVLNEA